MSSVQIRGPLCRCNRTWFHVPACKKVISVAIQKQSVVKELDRTWEGNKLFRKEGEDTDQKYTYLKKDCKNCEEKFYSLLTQCKKGKGEFCSSSCVGSYYAKKRDQTGENNPNWKGGASDNQKRYQENKQEYLRRSRENRAEKREWLEEYKSDLECEECGEDRSACLEFHHEDPDEKFKEVSKMVPQNYSIEKIKEEIEKCKVLCSNCHKILHFS